MARTMVEKFTDAAERDEQQARCLELQRLLTELLEFSTSRFNVGELLRIMHLRQTIRPSQKEIKEAKFLLQKANKKPGKINLSRSGSR